MTGSNPNLDFANINAYTMYKILGKAIHLFLKILNILWPNYMVVKRPNFQTTQITSLHITNHLNNYQNLKVKERLNDDLVANFIKIVISIKDHNSFVKLRKITGSNPNIDLIIINAHTEFSQIILISSQDIERR